MKVTKKINVPFLALSIDDFIPDVNLVKKAAKSFDEVKSEDWVKYSKEGGQVQYCSKIPRKSTEECLVLLDYISDNFKPSDYFPNEREVFPDLSHYGGGMMLTPNSKSQGGYLGMHIDADIHGINKNWKREYSAVLCISEDYDESFDLLVHNGKQHDRLEYKFNRLNVFKCTPNSWHGFPTISPGFNRKVLGVMFWSIMTEEQVKNARIKAKFNNNLKFD